MTPVRAYASEKIIDTDVSRVYVFEGVRERNGPHRQGIGVDVHLDAVTSMPKHVFDHVISLIHAQILMCVLVGQEKERKAELERAMLCAADRFLSPEAIRQRSKLSP